MSHLPETWPLEGWNDPIARFWKDENGKTEWFGYFGRGIQNADQESFFEADDDWDDEFMATSDLIPLISQEMVWLYG